jgi:hypothetical protein
MEGASVECRIQGSSSKEGDIFVISDMAKVSGGKSGSAPDPAQACPARLFLGRRSIFVEAEVREAAR